MMTAISHILVSFSVGRPENSGVWWLGDVDLGLKAYKCKSWYTTPEETNNNLLYMIGTVREKAEERLVYGIKFLIAPNLL